MQGRELWGRAWQERWPLERTVRILLECILVVLFVTPDNFVLPSYREQTTSSNGDNEAGDRPNQEDQGKKDVQSPINWSN